MKVTTLFLRSHEIVPALVVPMLLASACLSGLIVATAAPMAGTNLPVSAETTAPPAAASDLCAELVRQLASSPLPEVRMQAIQRMTEEMSANGCDTRPCRCPFVRPSLLAAARRDSSEEVRDAAITGLFHLGPLDDAAVDTLIALLTLDPSERLRYRAEWLFRSPQVHSPSVPERLQAALGRLEDPKQRWQVALAFERSGSGVQEAALRMAAAIVADSASSPAWGEAMALLFRADGDSIARALARPVLLRSLRETRDVQRRSNILQGLTRTREPWPEVEPDLWRILREDPDAGLRSVAAECLGRYPWTGDMSRVVESCRAEQPVELRRLALRHVEFHARAGDPMARQALAETMDDADLSIAQVAIRAMLRIEPGQPRASRRAGEVAAGHILSGSCLNEWRQYEDWPVGPEGARIVLAALEAAREVKSRAQLAGLLGLWDEGMSQVREAAPQLLRLTESREDPWVRREAVLSLGSLRADSSRVVPHLCKLVRRDPEASVRSAACGALGKLRAMRRLSGRALLAALAADPNEQVRSAATRSLTAVGNGDAREFLAMARAARIDPSRHVRWDAIVALPAYSAHVDAALSLLEGLLESEGQGLRQVACETIRRMPAPHRSRARLLESVLRVDPDARNRQVAAIGLAKEGEAALPVLRWALEYDADPDVRDEAAYSYIEARLPPGEATRGLMETLDTNRGIGHGGPAPIQDLGWIVGCMLKRCEDRLDHLSEDPDRVAMWILTGGSRPFDPSADPCAQLDEYCTWRME